MHNGNQIHQNHQPHHVNAMLDIFAVTVHIVAIKFKGENMSKENILENLNDGVVKETVTEFFYCPECGCRIVLSLKIDGVEREIRSN